MKKKIEKTPLEKLKQPKDRWALGHELIKLKKEFPLDNVLRKMIKIEFHENKPFRHPEDYDVYDPREELQRKLRDINKGDLKAYKAKIEENERKAQTLREELKMTMMRKEPDKEEMKRREM